MTSKTDALSCQVTENDLKSLLRNALLAAGKEMGEEGDHWPVIKNTITDIMHDFEKLDIERAVTEEVQKHYYAHLEAMERALETCDEETKAIEGPRLAELREVYDAAFKAPKETVLDLTADDEETDENLPIHCRRAEAIIETLYEDDELVEDKESIHE